MTILSIDMTWPEAVRAVAADMGVEFESAVPSIEDSDNAAMYVLWNFTAFPMTTDPEVIEQQLRQFFASA